MIVTLEDIMIGARTIYGEARGEKYDGMKAIGHVLINRVARKIGDPDHTIASAALRHRQYSAWNEGDANRIAMQEANVSDPTFRKCLSAMIEALDEADPTNGARHYMTAARLAQGWPKSWGPERKPVARIGDHLFFNDVP